MAVQIGCFNRPWNMLSFDHALESISKAGFECVGFLRQNRGYIITGDSTPAEINAVSKKCASYGLPIAVAFLPLNLSLPVEEAAEDFKKQIDAVNILGVDTLLMMGAKVDLRDAFCEVVSLCTEHAAKKNVTLAMKPHGGISAVGKDCLDIVERIGSDSFRIYYDPGNVVHYAGAVPHEDVKAVAKYVTGLCIKDSRGRGEGVNVSPGKGTVDFPKFFGVLFEAGFDGAAVVETLGGETPEEVDAEAKYTYDFLCEVIRGA